MARLVPSLVTQIPGNPVNAALWNAGPKAVGDFYTAAPIFRGRQNSAIITATATWYAQPLATIDVDSDSGHSGSGSQYVCQVAGWYWVMGAVAWAGTGVQQRIDAAIAKNGAVVLGSQQSYIKPASDFSAISAETTVYLALGDYVEVWGRQMTGGNVNTFVGSDLCPSLNVLWVHS